MKAQFACACAWIVMLGGIADALGEQRVAPTDSVEDSRDLLLAALGTATVECLGTTGPENYTTTGGVLARTFRTCPGDPAALGRIDALLGVQFSEQGRADDLAGYYVATWDSFVESFPRNRIESCPTWALVNVIDAPTRESVARLVRLGRPGKENRRYQVSSTECGTNGDCAVRHAQICARGFGNGFVVDTNSRRSTVEVDPAWWLLDAEVEPECDPIDDPYVHGFCDAIGSGPETLYGAIERAGEGCCVWRDGQLITQDGHFEPIDCDGSGWYCMTVCVEN